MIAFPTQDHVVIVRANGGGMVGGISVGSEDTDIAWSPDGKLIAVTAGPLYVKALGGTRRRLTRGHAFSPSWSPDGRLIAYVTASRLFVVRADGRARRRLGPARGVSGEEAARVGPSWSPDGRLLVHEVDGTMYVVNVRTGMRRRMAPGPRDASPLWSPNGRWIAFTRTYGRKGTPELYLIRPNGTGLRRLTRTRDGEGWLSWSPGGRRLGYVGRGGDVFAIDVDSRRTSRITRTTCGEGADRLAWSPRGNQMAFRSDPVGRDADLYTTDPSNATVTQLTDNCRLSERNPAWSPSGDQLAYDRGWAGPSHIYVMRADRSGVRRVTGSSTRDADPIWSPDTSRLVFSRWGNADAELFTISTDGTDERQLTNSPGYNYSPAWSPADSRIAFASSRGGPAQIYVMNADGSGTVRLTDDGGTDPDWSLDGSRIVFIRGCNLWTMKADGTDPVRLAVRELYCDSVFSPAWSPDGTQIVFSADVDGGRGSQYALFVVDAADGTLRSLIHDNQDNLQADWQPIP
jgi:Tol biopolymer transport system component